MILSAENKHPTARKRLRSLMTLVTPLFHRLRPRSLQAFCGGERHPDDWGPSGGEAEFDDATSLCTVCLTSSKDMGSGGGFRHTSWVSGLGDYGRACVRLPSRMQKRSPALMGSSSCRKALELKQPTELEMGVISARTTGLRQT